jgi:hypothetical protein
VTSSLGQVRFDDLAAGPVIVTVSKQGFQGAQQSVTIIVNGIAQLDFALPRGSGGPSCFRSLIAVPGTVVNGFVRIKVFQIDAGADSTPNPAVTLNATFEGLGAPTNYRVSESADTINNAPWIVLPSGGIFPTYTLIDDPQRPSRYGTKTVYFQVRVNQNVSNIAKDDIVLKPPKLKKYALAGDELKQLLNYSKDQGFTFSSRFVESSFPKAKWCQFPDGSVDLAVPGMTMAVNTSETFLINPPDPGESRRIDGFFFGGRKLNPFWRIISVPAFGPKDLWGESAPESNWQVIREPASDDPGFTVRFKFTRKRIHAVETFPFYSDALCRTASIQLLSISLEGPEDDNWVDVNRKWKNAFIKH